jgi:hypothetical protein
LVLLTLLAFGLRLTLLAFGPGQESSRGKYEDSWRMVLLAENLRRFGSYGKEHEDGLVHKAIARLRADNGTLPAPDPNGLRPESFRPPGYPFFYAAAQSLCSDDRLVLLLQALWGAFLPALVVNIVQALGVSRRGAFVAGGLWALHPALVLFDCAFLTESLFNALAITGLVLLGRSRSPGHLAGGGLLLGLAGLVRPLAILYAPLALALAYRRGRGVLQPALLLGCLMVLPSGLWALRNLAAGEGLRVSTVADVNLLYYSAAYAISEERGEDWEESWPARIKELSAKLEERIRPGEDVFLVGRRLALEEMRARPVAVLRVHVKSVAKLFLDQSVGSLYAALGRAYTPSGLFSRFVLREGAGSPDGATGPVVASLAWTLLNGAITLAAVLGVIRGWRSGFRLPVTVSVLTLLLFTLATGSVGIERMRLPIFLPLLLLAGGGVCGWSREPRPGPCNPQGVAKKMAKVRMP